MARKSNTIYESLTRTEVETVQSEAIPGRTFRRYFIDYKASPMTVMQISKAVESHHKSNGETVSVLFAVGMRGLADKPGHLVALVY